MSSQPVQDELGKYLSRKESPTTSRPGGNLKGPRPPVKPAAWRSPSTNYNAARSDLVYPMSKMNVKEEASSNLGEQVQRLQEAVGDAIHDQSTAAAPPSQQQPKRTSRGAADAFEASLSRRSIPRPPAAEQQELPSSPGPRSPPPPPPTIPTKPLGLGNPPPKPPSKPSFMSSPPTTTTTTTSISPTPSDINKVSVPNPIYMGTLCAGCDKPIAGRMVRVEQRQWHVDCFQCKHCGQDLEHVAFHTKDGYPYCALDFHELFSTRCDYCNTPIEEKSISALGKHYHVGHFFCRECSKPFDESSAFMVHDGHPYCEKDYMRKFGHKCMGCSEYITGEFLVALDGDWHKDCFVCADCGKAFTSNSFFVRNNKPYCEHHYKHPLNPGTAKICRHCKEVIDGRAVSAFNQDYHPHHFQCNKCNKLLSARVPGMWQEGAPGELICKMCARRP